MSMSYDEKNKHVMQWAQLKTQEVDQSQGMIGQTAKNGAPEENNDQKEN